VEAILERRVHLLFYYRILFNDARVRPCCGQVLSKIGRDNCGMEKAAKREGFAPFVYLSSPRSGSINDSLESENIARRRCNKIMQCINYWTGGLADMSFRTTHIVAIILGSLLFTFVAIAVVIIVRWANTLLRYIS